MAPKKRGLARPPLAARELISGRLDMHGFPWL
jgi:hypothetical protein